MEYGFRDMPLHGGPLDGQYVDASTLTNEQLREGLALINDANGAFGPGGRSHYALDDHGVMRWQYDTP